MAKGAKRLLGEVLVLDDQLYLAKALAEVLERELPCTAQPSDRPRESIAQMLERPFDLVITDERMDDRDGLAVLAEIKALAPQCEVILVTEYGSYDSAVAAMRLGAFDYVRRDYESEEWLHYILRVTGHALRFRPARREHHRRENLIHFFLERTKLTPLERSIKGGDFDPGLALEYAAKLLLESSLLNVTHHRFRSKTEEVDLVCECPEKGTFWKYQRPLVLVECKDLGKDVPGANERSRFEEKIRNRKGQATVGLFISTSGFADTFRISSSPSPVVNGPLPVVVPIDGTDILGWLEAEDRFKWLTAKAMAST